MNYNPYDLVPLLVNNKSIHGRPFEFSSTVTDHKRMTNALGELVKPTKITTVCPDCGQGMQLDVALGEPPFQPLAITCVNCNPDPPPVADPFMNPVKSGRVTMTELDPVAYRHGDQLVAGQAIDQFVVPDEFPVTQKPLPAKLPPGMPEKFLRHKKAKQKKRVTTPKKSPAKDQKAAKCCERDHNNDGNCDIHSAPGVLRNQSLIISPFDKVPKSENTEMAEEVDFNDQDMIE